MSEYPAAVHAATQRARAKRGRVKPDGTRLLGVTLIAGVAAAYAVAGGGIYLLVASMSGRALVAGGLLILFVYFALLCVAELSTTRLELRRDARAMKPQLSDRTPRYRATWGAHYTRMGVSK